MKSASTPIILLCVYLLFLACGKEGWWSVSGTEVVGGKANDTSSNIASFGVKVVDPDNPFIDYVADFQPFRDGIIHALRKSGNLSGAPCFIPDGAITFTLSNHHLFPLLALRHKIMNKANITHCQEQRFITVCLDKKCQAQCHSSGFMNCVHLTIPETMYSQYGSKESLYQKNSYNYIVWVKYEMFIEALMVANEAFYFDADVMLFGNPYPDAFYGRNEQGKQIPGPYDLMYQRERGMKELGCGGSVNGGLFYIRNSTGMHEKFFPAIMKHRADIINLVGRLDQDIVGDYVNLVKYCTLPVKRFMGFCLPSQNATGWIAANVITFHTNCVSGLQNKMDAIKDFAKGFFGHWN